MKILFKSASAGARFVFKEDWGSVIDPILEEKFNTESSQIEDLNKLMILLEGDEGKVSQLPEKTKEAYKNTSEEELMNSIILLLDSITQSIKIEIDKLKISIFSEENRKRIMDTLDLFKNVGDTKKIIESDLPTNKLLQSFIVSTLDGINEIPKITGRKLSKADRKKWFIDYTTWFRESFSDEQAFVDFYTEAVESLQKDLPEN